MEVLCYSLQSKHEICWNLLINLLFSIIRMIEPLRITTKIILDKKIVKAELIPSLPNKEEIQNSQNFLDFLLSFHDASNNKD
jgi:hypothetical protein